MNHGNPTGSDFPPRLASIRDPLTEQMAAELKRLGYRFEGELMFPPEEKKACLYPSCVDDAPGGKCVDWLTGDCKGPSAVTAPDPRPKRPLAIIAAAWNALPQALREQFASAEHETGNPLPVAVEALARNYAKADDSARGHVETIEKLQQQVRELRAFKDMVGGHRGEDSNGVWYWQGDGEDHLESIANALPVVIRAEQLRELIGDALERQYSLDDAKRLAGLWRAGKLIGGNGYCVSVVLLNELEQAYTAWTRHPKWLEFKDHFDDAAAKASASSPCIDAVEENGGPDNEDTVEAIHWHLYYAGFDIEHVLRDVGATFPANDAELIGLAEALESERRHRTHYMSQAARALRRLASTSRPEPVDPHAVTVDRRDLFDVVRSAFFAGRITDDSDRAAVHGEAFDYARRDSFLRSVAGEPVPDEGWRTQDEVYLTNVVHLLEAAQDALPGTYLAKRCFSTAIDVRALIECIRMQADPSRVPADVFARYTEPAAQPQPKGMTEPTDEEIAEAIEREFSDTTDWPNGDVEIVRAFLKHWKPNQAPAPAPVLTCAGFVWPLGDEIHTKQQPGMRPVYFVEKSGTVTQAPAVGAETEEALMAAMNKLEDAYFLRGWPAFETAAEHIEHVANLVTRMAATDDRQAFEEDVRGHFDPARADELLARDDGGNYVEWGVMLAWEAWKMAKATYESIHDDTRRLVRELDVALNGEAGAARQASLCDLVAQVKKRSADRVDGYQPWWPVMEVMRKALVSMQRYSFLLDASGGVRRVPDRSGRWIDGDAAHELFDVVAVQALIERHPDVMANFGRRHEESGNA